MMIIMAENGLLIWKKMIEYFPILFKKAISQQVTFKYPFLKLEGID